MCLVSRRPFVNDLDNRHRDQLTTLRKVLQLIRDKRLPNEKALQKKVDDFARAHTKEPEDFVVPFESSTVPVRHGGDVSDLLWRSPDVPMQRPKEVWATRGVVQSSVRFVMHEYRYELLKTYLEFMQKSVELVNAVARADNTTVLEVIRQTPIFQGPDRVDLLVANSYNNYGVPVLHTACANNYVDVVITLIDGGADLSVRDPDTGVRAQLCAGRR